MKPLLVTPGDPRGIGPEVAVKALTERFLAGTLPPTVLVGDFAAVAPWQTALPVVRATSLTAQADALAVYDPGSEGEPVEVRSLRVSVAACLDGEALGLVTGPIHKARLAATGFRHPGHTEFLGELCGVSHPVMAFVGGDLKVALATVHLPLRRVADALTVEGIAHVVRTADQALRLQLGVRAPRIAVCGVNPHAGDGGLLGDEEIYVIEPAVALVKAEGIDVHGPISAETAFRMAADHAIDLVVAMYHDQGLAPLKLVDFGRSVNWTLGLPIVRTSVDHGTADDIFGKGIADPTSFHAAFALAEQLTRV